MSDLQHQLAIATQELCDTLLIAEVLTNPYIMEKFKACKEALSNPPDTTAFDEYVKQRLGDVVYVSHYSRTQEQVEGGCTVPVYLVKD